ncbi:6-bladed beta-propeller [Alistipes sp.]|uniref:6-bladed beta-propeller n=1 Tax=Alistipes sp. TaxID=1872444 RepID=UPI003A8A2ADC
MKLIFFLINIIILFQSCSQNRKSAISNLVENERKLNIYDAIVEPEKPALAISDVVKLESPCNKALINKIFKIVHHKDQLYILTQIPQNSVLIFSDKGNFKCKIHQGRAKNELTYPMDITVDENTGDLYVLDLYRTVKIFSANGNFKRSIDLNIPLTYIEHLKGDDLVFYSSNIAKNTHNFYGLSQSGKIIGKYRNLYKGKPYLFHNVLSKLNSDSLLVESVFSDTIYLYQTKNKLLQPFFVLDYKGAGVNKKINEFADVESHMKYARNNNCFLGPEDAYFHHKKLFFFYSRGESKYWCIFNAVDNSLISYQKLFEELPNYYGRAGQSGELIIYPYNIPWLKKHFEKHPPVSEQGKRIEAMCANEDDNPIVVFAKF